MKYSICMTTYNVEDTIKYTLDSLENFDRPFELVVVDAGSNDDTRQIIREWKHDSRDVQLILKKGCNLGEGRQHAIENASCENVLVEIEADIFYEDVSKSLSSYEKLQQVEPGKALLITGNDGFLIGPRDLLSQTGYRPLQRREDQSMHDRLYKGGNLRLLTDSIVTGASKLGEDWVMTEAQIPNDGVIRTHEHDPSPGPIDSLKDWFHDSQALYRIGFDFPQLLRYCLISISFPKGFIAAVISSLARATMSNERWNDATAGSFREISQPKNHNYYDRSVIFNNDY